jgi:hypothetical protein
VRAGGEGKSEEEWDAWDEGGEEEEVESRAGRGETLGLWEVEKRLFADNQSARGVLEELGIEALGLVEARAVLRRRVEVGG